MNAARLAYLYRRASFLRSEFRGAFILGTTPIDTGLADLMDRCAAVFASAIAGETLP